MLKKLRTRLEPGYPVYLIDHSKKHHDFAKSSIELLDFEAKNGRIAWTVKCGTGHIISGLVRDQQEIPFVKRAWLTLAIPVCLNLRPKGFAPDFIICVPGSYGVISDLSKLR